MPDYKMNFGEVFAQAFMASKERQMQRQMQAEQLAAASARLERQIAAEEAQTSRAIDAQERMERWRQGFERGQQAERIKAQADDAKLGRDLQRELSDAELWARGVELDAEAADRLRAYNYMVDKDRKAEAQRVQAAETAARIFRNAYGNVATDTLGMPDPADPDSYERSFREELTRWPGMFGAAMRAWNALTGETVADMRRSRVPAGGDRAQQMDDAAGTLMWNFMRELERDPVTALSMAPMIGAAVGPMGRYTTDVMGQGDMTEEAQAYLRLRAAMSAALLSLGQSNYMAWMPSGQGQPQEGAPQ